MSSLGETFVTKAYDKKGGKMDYGKGKKEKRPMQGKAPANAARRPAPGKASSGAAKKVTPMEAAKSMFGGAKKKASPSKTKPAPMGRKGAPMSAAKKMARPMQSSPTKATPKRPAMPRMGDRKMQGSVMKQWDGRRWVTVG